MRGRDARQSSLKRRNCARIPRPVRAVVDVEARGDRSSRSRPSRGTRPVERPGVGTCARRSRPAQRGHRERAVELRHQRRLVERRQLARAGSPPPIRSRWNGEHAVTSRKQRGERTLLVLAHPLPRASAPVRAPASPRPSARAEVGQPVLPRLIAPLPPPRGRAPRRRRQQPHRLLERLGMSTSSGRVSRSSCRPLPSASCAVAMQRRRERRLRAVLARERARSPVRTARARGDAARRTARGARDGAGRAPRTRRRRRASRPRRARARSRRRRIQRGARGRRVRDESRSSCGDALVTSPLVDGEEQLLLAREVRVDRALRVAGVVGDRIDRARVEAVALEQSLGRARPAARVCAPCSLRAWVPSGPSSAGSPWRDDTSGIPIPQESERR